MRGTQSLVHIIGACWARPGILARELAWRWLFGIPLLAVLYYAGVRLLAVLLAAHTGITDFSLEDPIAAAGVIAASSAAITPELLRIASWAAPLLAIGWAVASGVGRSFVLRRLAPRTRFAPASTMGTLILLQLARILALGGSVVGWFAAVRWAAHRTLAVAEPNLVAYCAWVICLSLGIFTLWALFSWVFSVAPLLAVLEGRGVLDSLAASLRLGPLRGKLVEINLVLGIVKLALIVLAMVFSAIPLPFEAVMTGTPLYLWWVAVTILYLVASDFFQIAQLAAFIEFWSLYRSPAAPSSRG
ncbi:MAG: hypothetical protein ACR2JE_11165 [Acidobacteriaceae bacterium]